MDVRRFAVLAGNNARAKAYLQTMMARGLQPAAAVVLEQHGRRLAEHTIHDLPNARAADRSNIKRCPITGLVVDVTEHPTVTLQRHGIEFEVVQSLDPNSAEVVAALSRLPCDDCVYCGPGGIILKRHVFDTGKRLIHAHAGSLPDYRGSTTLYYSILLSGTIAVSVIALSPSLDAGAVLHTREYPVRPVTEFDHVVDPCLRADALTEYLVQRTPPAPRAQPVEGNTFFIIHPVLKHLAILKALGQSCACR